MAKLEVENKTISQKFEKLEKDGKIWYDETKRLVEFFDRFSPEQWEELLWQKEQKDRVEAEETQQKEKAEILEQLRKEGFGKAERKKTATNPSEDKT